MNETKFRFDRLLQHEKRGGGVTLNFLQILNAKLRNDLNHTNLIDFDSIWIECKFCSDILLKKKAKNQEQQQFFVKKNVWNTSWKNYQQILTSL